MAKKRQKKGDCQVNDAMTNAWMGVLVGTHDGLLMEAHNARTHAWMRVLVDTHDAMTHAWMGVLVDAFCAWPWCNNTRLDRGIDGHP
eukprot:536377-Pelagomonas_calceolata.AAC.6